MFQIASTVAAEKRPLSYQTLQSVHRARNCGVQTLPLIMHYGGGKLRKNWGWSGQILTPNELDLTFWVPNYRAKFHQNRVGTATAGEVTDRQTYRKSDFIICPMLSYSNGTDKNAHKQKQHEDVSLLMPSMAYVFKTFT